VQARRCLGASTSVMIFEEAAKKAESSLKEDMTKQIYHPLARQVAEETSVVSASLPQGSRGRESLDSNVRRRTLGSSRRPDRDWSETINAYERGGREAQSLDDLVVLKTAIILSMAEQARTKKWWRAKPTTSTFSSNFNIASARVTTSKTVRALDSEGVACSAFSTLTMESTTSLALVSVFPIASVSVSATLGTDMTRFSESFISLATSFAMFPKDFQSSIVPFCTNVSAAVAVASIFLASC